MTIKKIFFDYDVMMTSKYHYDTHPYVINRAAFNVCSPCSFGGVKAVIRTESRFR